MQQITITKVVFPEMAEAMRLHSSTQIRQCHPEPDAAAVLHCFQREICRDRSEIEKPFYACTQDSKAPKPHQKRGEGKVTPGGEVRLMECGGRR